MSDPKKRLFLDMDGTVARFHDNIIDSEGHVQIELMYEPEFFRNLEPFQNMIDAMKLFINNHPECEVYALSSAQLGDPPGFVRQKNEWLDTFLPEIDKDHRIYPEIGTAKSTYIPGGISVIDYLIDDFNKNLNEWIRDGGQSIKCKNNINQKGSGRYGGDIGNIWSGAMISNLDRPEKIFAELEKLMGLEHVQVFSNHNPYEKLFNEATANVPADIIGTFEDNKKEIFHWIEEWENDGYHGVDSKMADVMRNMIDYLVYTYGLMVKDSYEEWIEEKPAKSFEIEDRLSQIKYAMNYVYEDFERSLENAENILNSLVRMDLYTPKHKQFLLGHLPEVVYEEYNRLHVRYANNLGMNVVDCIVDSFDNCLKKEEICIEAYPVKDTYPPTEITISKRDLEFILKNIRSNNPDWYADLNEFLSEYTWDDGEVIKDRIEIFSAELKDNVSIKDFSEANYEVIISKDDDLYSGRLRKNIVDVFYPEEINEAFVKNLHAKGYNGLYIFISDINKHPREGEPFVGKVDADIIKNFNSLECLDDKIKNVKCEKNNHPVKNNELEL